ncbi:Uncharacterised protein [Neisseria meningitidis]|nr:Uncharacterised protein [Neisseria meningitidis]
MVVAGKDDEAFGRAVDEFDVAADVAAGFFHADDVGDFGKAQDSVVSHADDGTAGHVVDNHRNRSGFGDGFEMLVNAFLGGLVVIGDDGEGVVRPGFFGGLGKGDGFDGVVCPCAGDDGDAFGNVFDDGFDDGGVFFDGEGGGFACRADGNDAVRAVFNVPVD